MTIKTLVIGCTLLLVIYILVVRKTESFQRAEAALVCYWSDPGPPLPVPIPRDPESISMSQGPRTASLPPQQQKQVMDLPMPMITKDPTIAPTPSPSTLAPTSILQLLSSTAVPYTSPSTPPTPVPTLGVLSIPPEIKVTPMPMLV